LRTYPPPDEAGVVVGTKQSIYDHLLLKLQVVQLGSVYSEMEDFPSEVLLSENVYILLKLFVASPIRLPIRLNSHFSFLIVTLLHGGFGEKLLTYVFAVID